MRKVAIYIKISKKLRNALRRYKLIENRKIYEIVEEAIREYIKRHPISEEKIREYLKKKEKEEDF